MTGKQTDRETQAEHWLGTDAPAHLTLDPAYEHMMVVAYGEVWDGQPPEQTLTLEEDERIGFLLDRPDGDTMIGFAVEQPHDVDLDEIDADDLWGGPRFTVPTLGLEGASVGEILLAVQARFARDEPTNGAAHFHMAVSTGEELGAEEAVGYWRMALEAGEMRAHFGLGYTLLELGLAREAYGHLRVYTELTPHNGWAWSWLGRAAEEIGDPAEAANAYRRAIELEQAGGFETDAPELLQKLEDRSATE